MSNSFYNHTTFPGPNSPGSSALMRAEFQKIAQGFDKLPTLSGSAFQVVTVNSTGTGLLATSALTSLTVTASTLNSTTIGLTTPAAAAFTTASASGGFTGNVTGNLTGNVTGDVSSTGVSSFGNISVTGGAINGAPIGAANPQTVRGTLITATTGFAGPLTGDVTGNVTGNLTGGVTGNVQGNVTGNVTGNVQGNVTASSGTSTFTNLTVTGALTLSGSASISGLSAPVGSSDAANKGYVDTQDALRLALAGGTMTGDIAMNANRVTGMSDPVNAQDAATKAYADSVAQGLAAKASVKVATTANITLSGTQTIDGISVLAADRVLVKNQSAPAENGIYVCDAGAWTRSADADTWAELPGAFVFVEQGTINASNGFVCNVTAGGTLGTTPVTWVQFSGAGQITAGTGMTKSGNTLNVNTVSASRIVVNADDIDLATTGVSAGTYRSVTVDVYGRVTAGTAPTTLSGYGITDAYTTTQVDNFLNAKLNLSGGTMTGALAMGTFRITGVGDPVGAQDAATKNYIDVLYGSTASAAASASAAAASASSASGSASSATASASSATSAANSAAASFDSFDDRYLGSKTSDPATDNDGNALLTGALYWNSVGAVMKVWTGSAWLVFNPISNPVDQTDIGTAPNEIPLNQMLGSSAFLDASYFENHRISVISGNAQAERGRTYVLTASLTLTLPASPAVGDTVKVSNLSGTTTAVIDRNGSNIQALAEDLTIDTLNAAITLAYADATRGWVFV